MSTISVPEHLWETLIPLTKLDGMPLELLELLQQHIKPRIEDSSHEIPYDLIVRISKWCQSEEGVKKLEGADLDPKSYSLIPLLAGTIFAPSSKPPPPPEPQRDDSEDRRAITALINGLFSIVGVGFAVWWAAGNVYWRNETRALLALGASIVVAIAEGVLYLIWSSHLEQRKERQKKFLNAKSKRRLEAPDFETENPIEKVVPSSEHQENEQASVSQRRGYEYKNEDSTGT